ncbi:MAG: molybdenum cofactor guanylyltransferase MobA [Campylobacteraceae bacterium]|nr:molybdenum cofactor guanylyltransferase MobA [Campylobacteraceae bacterium]
MPCAIVAGGKSSRMGVDKALLPFKECKTLTQYQLQKVSNWFESIHISCKSRDKFDFEASFIEDSSKFDDFSPLVAIYSILEKLQTPVAILSVDIPFVTFDIYKKLYANLENFEAVIAKSPFGSHQMCAIYKPSILPILEKQIIDNNHKIKNLLARIETKYVEFKEDGAFFNLNKPCEYQEAVNYPISTKQA